jgi:hypothetical protein
MGEGPPGCKGCGRSVRPGRDEIQGIVKAYFAWCPHPETEAGERDRRLSICASCPDLLFGSTCRNSGCLVDVRARLADRACPAPAPRW